MESDLKNFLIDRQSDERLYQILKDIIFSNMIYDNDFNEFKYFIDEKSFNELTAFLDDKYNIKDWLRTRILESVGTSQGLDEYIKTLILYRKNNPSTNSPLNYLFSVSYLSRALDMYISTLLKNLRNENKLKNIDNKKIDYLIQFYEGNLNFRIKNFNVQFKSDEIEYLRSLILQESLNILYKTHVVNKYAQQINKKSLIKIKKIKDLNISQILNITENKYIKFEIFDNIIKYVYKNYPSIYLDKNSVYYSPHEFNDKKNMTLILKQIEFLNKSNVFIIIEGE